MYNTFAFDLVYWFQRYERLCNTSLKTYLINFTHDTWVISINFLKTFSECNHGSTCTPFVLNITLNLFFCVFKNKCYFDLVGMVMMQWFLIG